MLVRRNEKELSARQLGIFLICYLQDGPHAVRPLAAQLNATGPAISRALNRLNAIDFIRRKVDPLDHRSNIVHRTVKGAAFLRQLRAIMLEAYSENGQPRRLETLPVLDISADDIGPSLQRINK